MRIIDKLRDVATFVLGTVLLLLGLFSFSPSHLTTYGDAFHYYTPTALILIAIGGGLIALGAVIRSWRKP